MKTMFLLAIALAPAALWAQPPLCPLQNVTLNGIYVFTSSGTLVAPAPQFGGLTGSFASIAKIAFDGQGNLQVGPATLNINGTAIIRGANLAGSYTVNGDCTGTMLFGAASDPTAGHFDLVVTPDGKQANHVMTDKGTVLIGTLVRVNH